MFWTYKNFLRPTKPEPASATGIDSAASPPEEVTLRQRSHYDFWVAKKQVHHVLTQEKPLETRKSEIMSLVQQGQLAVHDLSRHWSSNKMNLNKRNLNSTETASNSILWIRKTLESKNKSHHLGSIIETQNSRGKPI